MFSAFYLFKLCLLMFYHFVRKNVEISQVAWVETFKFGTLCCRQGYYNLWIGFEYPRDTMVSTSGGSLVDNDVELPQSRSAEALSSQQNRIHPPFFQTRVTAVSTGDRLVFSSNEFQSTIAAKVCSKQYTSNFICNF